MRCWFDFFPQLFAITVIINKKIMSNQKHSLIEKDHQLEKLEFALAISRTLGDKIRSDQIKDQIEKIGSIYQEPGT
tara:strand:- start:765 stop:992 length:228 start_codon:yes stop_codon:yes gene_type:complete